MLSSAPTSFHPKNVKPVFSSVGSVTLSSIVYVDGRGVSVTYEPPFRFEYVSVYVVAVQSAVIVWFSAVVTVLSAVIVLLFNFHPLKSYPVFVGVGSSPYVLSNVTVLLVGSTIPPFGLYVTVYSFGVQCAYTVKLFV